MDKHAQELYVAKIEYTEQTPSTPHPKSETDIERKRSHKWVKNSWKNPRHICMASFTVSMTCLFLEWRASSLHMIRQLIFLTVLREQRSQQSNKNQSRWFLWLALSKSGELYTWSGNLYFWLFSGNKGASRATRISHVGFYDLLYSKSGEPALHMIRQLIFLAVLREQRSQQSNKNGFPHRQDSSSSLNTTKPWMLSCISSTVKRPKFDILFGENIFFLQNLFRWPPLKFFGGVYKNPSY